MAGRARIEIIDRNRQLGIGDRRPAAGVGVPAVCRNGHLPPDGSDQEHIPSHVVVGRASADGDRAVLCGACRAIAQLGGCLRDIRADGVDGVL